jgi:DNA-directed RNA polymerase subunit RPC12/RpoP
LELKEIKCSNCGKKIYIQQSHVREKTFCTLRCLMKKKDEDNCGEDKSLFASTNIP